METLVTQLKDDISSYFKSNQDYSDILVKEQYERYPKLKYPGITIEEIENEDDYIVQKDPDNDSKRVYIL